MTGPVQAGEAAGAIGGLMMDSVPVLSMVETVSTVNQRLASGPFETIAVMPVCQADGTLVGAATIEAIMQSAPNVVVGELMSVETHAVDAGTPAEVAVWHAVRCGISNLFVVDGQSRFLGTVPVERLFAVLEREHERDVARLGGFLTTAEAAAHASRESVGWRLVHRLPWLLVGLVGAIAAAGLMSSFEASLRSNLTLALFVPGVVYLADAVGTQTETLIIRGLSIGVPIRDVMARELLTGVIAGMLLGAIFLPVGLFIWDDRPVVVAVTFALAAACMTANTVAMLLPGMFARLGIDPAFGSGPLATVIQDLLSIAIFFGVAHWIV